MKILPGEHCSWRETFDRAADVAAHGGTITGAPTIRRGATLDGTNDYISYAVTDDILPGDIISIVVEFRPDFDYDEDAVRYLFDTTAGSRYCVFKDNNAASNVLSIYIGNTSIVDIASATYRDYWSVGKRNVLVVTGLTGNTSAWLNGTEILTSDPTGWASANPATLYVGADNAGANKFDGTIESVAIHHKDLMIQQDAQQLTNRSTFHHFDEAYLWADMEEQITTVSAVPGTLDKSRFGREIMLGDGVFAFRNPTFLDPGFSFNGSNGIKAFVDGTSYATNNEFTIGMAISPDFDFREATTRYFWDRADATLKVACWRAGATQDLYNYNGVQIMLTAAADLVPVWSGSGTNVIIMMATSGRVETWVNGTLLDSSATAGTIETISAMIIGSRQSFFSAITGVVHWYGMWPAVLSHTQVRYLTHYLQGRFKR